ncbi:hypothetical protein VNI00_002628 [Paramarasmius palmivorus]|uniref:G-patch domain-containing protein n=1 Tax=Paramarasmius palmivorus TaxID=297713 RepID=A0AAW0E1M9_9AGAR
MPLDGHSYLVSQGWSGKGTGLRQGAIAKPIAITQKKTLAGLGKDRDEAFPFWDHLFSAASKTIQVKISSNDSDVSDSDTPAENSAPTLKRTTTGILCNRRPVDVTPATTSGTSTPDIVLPDAPKFSLVALAKREAAKQNLYSRFYRGPIIGPDDEPPREQNPPTTQQPNAQSVNISDSPATEGTPKKKKKRKAEELEKEERRERKRMKKEAKEAKERERERKKQKKLKKAEKAAQKLLAEEEIANGTTDDESERRRRKREAKLKRQANGVEEEEAETSSEKSGKISAPSDDRKSSKKRKKKTEAIELETSEVPTIPKAKKKRKDD